MAKRGIIAKVAVYGCVFWSFLFLYYVTGADFVHEKNFDKYPFGADTPYYMRQSIGTCVNIFKHSPTAIMRAVFLQFSDNIKLLNATVGALNIALALAFFNLFLKMKVSILCACIYGFSLSIWFFSSFPESYIVTATLVTCFLFLFSMFRNTLSPFKVFVLGSLMLSVILASISCIVVMCIPLIYYGKQFVLDRVFRRRLVYSYTAIVLIAAAILSFLSFRLLGLSPYDYYTNLDRKGSKRDFYSMRDLREPILNLVFFDIAAPAKEVSYCTRAYPHYMGFFKPSIRLYLESPCSCVYLIMHFLLLVLFAYTLICKREKCTMLIYAFLGYSLPIIMYYCFFFNPGEAILYSAPLVLPMLFMLFYTVTRYMKDAAFFFLLVFTIVLFVTNLCFFSKYLPWNLSSFFRLIV